jgi:DNA replication licensing factor MCM6
MEPSSPTAPAPTLPPSSDPGDDRDIALPRRTGDALTLDEADRQDVDESQDGASARKRRRPRTQANGDVPLVKDAIGESLADSFEAFLRT